MSALTTYIEDYVGAPDEMFTALWQLLPWEHRDGAPRRECWFNPYGLEYTYGSGEFARTYQAHDLTENDTLAQCLITSFKTRLNTGHNTSFDCCFVNGYEHGRQHLGWHADDSPEMDMNHPIAVVSLGAAREIWFRHKDDRSGENVSKRMLGNGSLLLMHSGMQRDWQHRIPKSSVQDCGPRLSLTFRKLVLG